MADNNLAKIQRVSLREGWEHEARDFTPWLADNIYELNEARDVDLEVQEQESSVGSRSLDILAIDLSDGRPVIIENQLERTDNDHLSRLLIAESDSYYWTQRAEPLFPSRTNRQTPKGT